MFSKRCESKEDDRRTTLCALVGPIGGTWSTRSYTHAPSSWNTKTYFSLDGYTIIKSNMDHMRISGIESLSVILSRTKYSY